MSNLWERFESIATPEEVQEAAFSFKPIEAGEYNATLESIEAGESQSGLPMLKGKFRLDNNRPVFYNQVLQNLNYPAMSAKNIAEALQFVSGLVGEEVEFKGLGSLGELVETIPAGGVFRLDLTYDKKDYDQKFPKLKVIGIADASGDMPY